MRPSGRATGRRRRGSTMAETALVLPLFFMLIFGLIEVGRMGMIAQLLSSAANAGCRVAVIGGHSKADATAAIRSVLAAGGVSSGDCTISMYVDGDAASTDITTAHLADSDYVTVTIAVPFSKVSWLPTPIYLGSTSLGSSATLTSERP